MSPRVVPLRTPSVPCFLLALLVLLPQFATPMDSAGPVDTPRPARETVRGPSWTLGLRLYRSLRADGTQNPLFSPLLLANSLVFLAGGSGGATAEQFLKVLGTTVLPVSGQTEALTSLYGGNGTSFKLHSSSALFTGPDTPLDTGILKDTRAWSRLEHIALQPEGGRVDREVFHAWARSAMGGVEGAQLKRQLEAKAGALVFADALRFKGLWDRRFDEGEEDLRSFLGTVYTKVPMMHRAGVYRHYEDVKNMVQVLELDMWGGGASMVLLLPFHVESLARLEKVLTQDLLGEWLDRLSEQSIVISLPKVKLVSALTLQKQLSVLGLTDAWDEKKADFSGVSGTAAGQSRLHLGGILHWASLELGPESGVQEGEVEDENVTQPKLFYADHSFIVLVKDNKTGALLLMGALDQAEGPALHDEL